MVRAFQFGARKSPPDRYRSLTEPHNPQCGERKCGVNRYGWGALERDPHRRSNLIESLNDPHRIRPDQNCTPDHRRTPKRSELPRHRAWLAFRRSRTVTLRAVPHTALQERRTPAASGVSPVVAGAVLGQALAGHTRPCGPRRIELRCAPSASKKSISCDVVASPSVHHPCRRINRWRLRRPKGSENFSERLRLKTFRPTG